MIKPRTCWKREPCENAPNDSVKKSVPTINRIKYGRKNKIFSKIAIIDHALCVEFLMYYTPGKCTGVKKISKKNGMI